MSKKAAQNGEVQKERRRQAEAYRAKGWTRVFGLNGKWRGVMVRTDKATG